MATPISFRLFHSLFVSGCPVEGEVALNYRALQEDEIEEVHVKLRGSVRTCIKHDKSKRVETISIVREDVSLWRRGSAYPPAGSDILCIPFRLFLPAYCPPSFQVEGLQRNAAIRYAVTAVGVRPGAFQFNRRICIPIAVVPGDVPGAAVRETLNALAAAGAECEWRVERKTDLIRRGLWGEYSKVEVQLLLPKIPVFPIHTPIPFVIKVKSVSAPLTRKKADALPENEPAFPPVPSSYTQMEFKLHSKMWMSARGSRKRPSRDVTVFRRSPSSMMAADVPPREWVPLADQGAEKSPETKGTWVQHATFQSTFQLDCPPTFSIDTLQCEYLLMLEVPFPGIGNDVHIDVPVMVTSGLIAPVAPLAAMPGGTGREIPLALPPDYWDASGHEWEDTKG